MKGISRRIATSMTYKGFSQLRPMLRERQFKFVRIYSEPIWRSPFEERQFDLADTLRDIEESINEFTKDESLVATRLSRFSSRFEAFRRNACRY